MTPQATGTTHPDPDHEAETYFSYADWRRSNQLRAILPLILHFVVVIVLIVILRTYIDGHHFNLEVRSPKLSGFTPLQSDITTAISAGVAVYRISATMWSGAMLWHCIFILLGDGGISLEKLDRLLTWQIHIPPHLLSSQALVSIILLTAFPSPLSGPILTGSITWSSSYRLVVGSASQCVTGIPGEQCGSNNASVSLDNTLTSGFASTAWLNSLEDERTMKRVIDNIAHLPIDSTLNNVTLPYFAISRLEWIRDPITEIPQTLLNRSAARFTGDSTGLFALIRGSDPRVDPECSIVSETQIIVGIFSNAAAPTPPSAYPTHAPYPRRAPLAPGPCTSSSLFGDLPPYIGFTASNNICLIYGRVTYVAGAAECSDCRISSRVTVQNDSALMVLPSTQTQAVINMMPLVGDMMVLQKNSLPRAYNNLNRYVTELLIRSYAASWTHFRKSTNMTSLSAEVKIAIPTSRASIMWWRVWVWFSLNLLFTLSGLLFLVVQRLSGQKFIESPQLAAVLLDTSEFLHKRDRAFCNFSSLTKDDKGIGNLRLVRNWDQGGHKQVEFAEE